MSGLPSLILSWILIQAVLLYRVTLGRLLVGQCRFNPTCSQYAIDAIKKYGPLQGGLKAARRILRCRPRGPSGYDPA
jgi:putative membrane protein insertion efficiency factor